MEKELTDLFEKVKKAAAVAENSPAEEDRCLDALEQLKQFPVNYDVLVSTQVGKHVRLLTKHGSDKIKALASDVVQIWKNIIVQETARKKNGTSHSDGTAKAETNGAKDMKRSTSLKIEKSAAKTVKVEKSIRPVTPTATKSIKSESSSIKVEVTTKNENLHVKKEVKVEKSVSDAVAPPKLNSLVSCKDETRDNLRKIIAEALCKVPAEVNDDLKGRVNQCDPYRVAVMVETALFEKLGKSTGAQKQKYRSILFNIKDSKNPDFRRKILLGDFEPHVILDLTAEQMASDARQQENQALKQKAMFNSERAAAPKASTDQFTCGRCKKKETTYYQLQTRSADEPMTTFVTCVNCNNHWKFC